jgi:hypothetical protein
MYLVTRIRFCCTITAVKENVHGDQLRAEQHHRLNQCFFVVIVHSCLRISGCISAIFSYLERIVQQESVRKHSDMQRPEAVSWRVEKWKLMSGYQRDFGLRGSI